MSDDQSIAELHEAAQRVLLKKIASMADKAPAQIEMLAHAWALLNSAPPAKKATTHNF